MQAQTAYTPYLTHPLPQRCTMAQERVRQMLLVTAQQWGVRAMAQQAAAMVRPCRQGL